MIGCDWHQLDDQAMAALGRLGLESATEAAIIRYVNSHVRPGGFLSALVSNDLVETFRAADDNNGRLVREIVGWFYNYPTSQCWHGSREHAHWLNRTICKPKPTDLDLEDQSSPDHPL
jgi:hypothetical protein